MTRALLLFVTGLIAACTSSGGGADPPLDIGPDAAAEVADTTPDSAPDSVLPSDVPAEPDADAAPTDPREAWRALSLLTNVSFEVADGGGGPADWTCYFAGEGAPPEPLCQVLAAPDAAHGAHVLWLAPGALVYQDAYGLEPERHIWFSVQADRAGGVAAADFTLFGSGGPPDYETAWTVAGRAAVDPSAAPWTQVDSASGPSDGLELVRFIAYNGHPTEPLEVDDLVVVPDTAAHVVPGHLLMAEHHGLIDVAAGGEEAALWVPLPLDHGVQVPLHVELSLDPPVASAIEYTVDEVGNLGAVLRFAPETAAFGVALWWRAVVLTLQVPDAELGAFYPADIDPATWTVATEVVDCDYPGIAAIGADIAADQADPEATMGAVLAFTSAHIGGGDMPDGLDAVTAYESQAGSCTSFGNLSAAVGRAAGLPARTVANYLVGSAQQTHSITEFWLGAGAGWRLVEPQGTTPRLAADYAVVVRLDLPSDEGPESMAGLWGWGYQGVPTHSLVHPLAGQGAARLGSRFSTHFVDCAYCDNRADYQAPLHAEAAAVRATFDLARARWQQTLARWTAAGPDPAEQAIRAAALAATDLDAIDALLAEVEGHQDGRR